MDLIGQVNPESRLKMRFSKAAAYTLICLLFLLAFSPYHAILKADHVADDASYLSHGFTLGLDFNLQYKDMIADWKTSRGIAAHPIGPGILAAPFITAFSLIDRIMHHEVIENHRAYQYSWSLFGFIFSSVFFFLFGLNLYSKALDCLGLKLSRVHFLFVSSSFGILFYVLFRPIMGHAFEFFSIALCFWASCKIVNGLSSPLFHYRYYFFCALGMILTLTIRPANINIFLLPVIVVAFALSTEMIDKIELRKALPRLGLLIGFSILLFAPLAYLNYSLYGVIFPSSDVMYGPNVNPVPHLESAHDFLTAMLFLVSHLPQLWIICFSSEFGLAFSSAILFFGTIFIIYFTIRKIAKTPAISFANLACLGAYVGLPVVITLFWQSNGDAYAYRFLFCLFPIALLGYSFWKNRLKKQDALLLPFSFFQKSLNVTINCLCAYGILASILIGLNNHLMYNEQPNAFNKPNSGGAVGYNIAVIEALPKVSTWINLFATRTTGFLAIGALQACHIDVHNLPLPTALQEKMEKFRDYVYPPLRVYLQVSLLILLSIGATIRFCKPDFNNPKL